MKKWRALLIPMLFAICLSSVLPAMAAEWFTRQLEAVYRNIKIVVDGEEFVPLDVNGKVVEPFIVDGTVYVPLRAIGNAFGKEVEWDSKNSIVSIRSPYYIWDELAYQIAPPPAPSKNVTISTPQELVDAIAPDTCITLKSGVYNLSTVTDTQNPYVQVGSWMAALIVSNVEGLTLMAEPGAKVEIVTPNRFSEVLMFTFCNGITLSGIEAGHTVTGEYECDAGVVLLDQSMNITIEDCLLYGSGAIGISFDNCLWAHISNTTITDCSLRAIDLWGSSNITFTNCKFVDNRAYGSVIFGYYSSAEFFDCEITGNKNLLWSAVEFDYDVLFERCVFRNNALSEGSEPIFKGQGIFLRNCEIEKAGFSEYWNNGVFDLGGNKLM